MIEVEKDGNLILQRHGANCYDNLLAPQVKFGAYAPTWSDLSVPPEFKTREICLRTFLRASFEMLTENFVATHRRW